MLLGQFTITGEPAGIMQVGEADAALASWQWAAEDQPYNLLIDSPPEFAQLFSRSQAWLAWDGDLESPPPTTHLIRDLIGHDLVGQRVESFVITPAANTWTGRFFGEVPEPSSLVLAAVIFVAFLFRRR